MIAVDVVVAVVGGVIVVAVGVVVVAVDVVVLDENTLVVVPVVVHFVVEVGLASVLRFYFSFFYRSSYPS